MEHITKAATVTATTELGEFVAIAAAYTVDRVGDRIVFGAFSKTIAKWQASGKRVPLHWDHRGEATNVIGSVDPSTMQEVEGVGLRVAGIVDINESETAKEAWRSMKNGAMSLSFGYLVPQGMQKNGKDGENELHEVDLFEISIVPAPANPDTRILSMKSAEGDKITAELHEVREQLAEVKASLEDLKNSKSVEVTAQETKSHALDPLRSRAMGAALEVMSDGLGTEPPVKQEPEVKAVTDEEVREMRRRSKALMIEVLSGG